ncbi:MAG TPA: PAS domain S-box protein [Polyangiaceae bacterium]|nr:PAS domain S-box protein [Polyangiaceae bacterium]
MGTTAGEPASGSLDVTEAGARVAAVPRTVEERESELARLSRLYEALRQVGQAIVSVPTRAELFERLCRVLVEQAGMRMSWIGWQQPDSSVLAPLASFGDDEGYLQAIRVLVNDLPEGRGPTGTAFREARPYVCNDLQSDTATLPWRAEAERRGFRASAAFPVREGGEVRGTLTVYAGEVGYFGEREISLIAQAANDLSFGLDNLTREQARKHAEQALRRERDFSNAVLASLPGVFYLYDKNGKFLRWNRNFERVTGYTAEEISLKQPLDFFHPAERPLLAERIRAVFDQGESTAEAGFLSKDGRLTPYHFTGVRAELDHEACLVGVGIDISERVGAAAAVARSDARYRALFEQAPDGILIADPQSYYLDANPSMCGMLGYTRDELVGKHASDIVVAAELPEVGVALDTIKSGNAYHRELRFRRKDGSTFAAEVMATQMPDGNLVGIIRDVTQRKLAEAALRELNDTLEQKVALRTSELQQALVRAEAADRLKSAFLATMSHELRTPLNSILGFTGIVLQGMAGPLTPEQTKQLGMVRGSARHLLDLINDLLDLSKIEAEQLEVHHEVFDLRASLDKVMASVAPQAEKKGLWLRTSVVEGLTEIESDRRRVEQMLLNLVSNAIKFTERGGVTLTVERVAAFRVEVDAPPRRAVRLRVADTGIGVKPEHLPKLFQPFSQLDTGLSRQHEGTGLGLAICRRLAGLLGGEIRVRSEWAKGSEFTITLPCGGDNI